MVKVAVVGAGHWGKNLVRNFASLKNAELKYVVDLDEKVRQTMSSLYPQAKAVADISEALGDPSVNTVVVAVEAPLHHKIAKTALQAGKHTYVEKPLAKTDSRSKIGREIKRITRVLSGEASEDEESKSKRPWDFLLRGQWAEKA